MYRTVAYNWGGKTFFQHLVQMHLLGIQHNAESVLNYDLPIVLSAKLNCDKKLLNNEARKIWKTVFKKIAIEEKSFWPFFDVVIEEIDPVGLSIFWPFKLTLCSCFWPISDHFRTILDHFRTIYYLSNFYILKQKTFLNFWHFLTFLFISCSTLLCRQFLHFWHCFLCDLKKLLKSLLCRIYLEAY